MRTFFLYAVVELAVLAALTWAVGIGWTLLILLATSVIGVALAGSQVKKQILKLSTRTDPQGAVADSMLVALGTVLMFIPGIVSTAVGALMLLPPLVAWCARWPAWCSPAASAGGSASST
ncbi:FxsA family protein [Mycolicibacterium aichiense]|uniref:FxsA family protein n=1 Tax=Mycolicibacterium aichiense TaxID=1799 RepID=UPI003D665013